MTRHASFQEMEHGRSCGHKSCSRQFVFNGSMDKFNVREDFIGLYKLESTKSDDIFNMLQDSLLVSGLWPPEKLRGQSYDGAANMSGKNNGVVKKIQECQKEQFIFIAMDTLSIWPLEIV